MSVRREVFGNINDYRRLTDSYEDGNGYGVSDFLTSEGVAEAAFGQQLQGVAANSHKLFLSNAARSDLFKPSERHDQYAIDQWADLIAGRALYKTLEQLAIEDSKEKALWGDNNA